MRVAEQPEKEAEEADEMEKDDDEAEETEKEDGESEDDEKIAAFNARRTTLREKRRADFKQKNQKGGDLNWRHYYQEDVEDLTKCYM